MSKVSSCMVLVELANARGICLTEVGGVRRLRVSTS